MNAFLKKILVPFFLVLALFAAACSGPDESSPADGAPAGAEPEAEGIVLGGIAPLTGSAAEYGIPNRRASELAVSEVNAAGGINGVPIGIVWDDAMCDGQKASAAAERLSKDPKISIVLGGVCSDETLAAGPVLNEAGKILLTSGSSSSEISNLGDYVFRNYPSNKDQAKALAEFVSESQSNAQVAVLVENTKFAEDLGLSFEENYESLGGQVSVFETFDSSVTDFASVVEKAKDASNVVLLTQTSDKSIKILQEIKSMNLNPNLFSGEILAQKEVLGANPELLEGLVVVNRPPLSNPKAQEFFEKYRQTYNEEAGWAQLAASSYDSIYMLRDAMLECNGDRNIDCIRDHLYAIQNYDGVVPGLSINENGDAVGYKHVVYVAKGGQFVEASS